MATYAIGDVQGCYTPLRRLLDALRFEPARDRLLFAGDLVNRGPESLQMLRFVSGLGSAAVTVLGNHDLHLLALARGGRRKRRDTLDPILAAPDREELLAWLARCPLAWEEGATLLVHAGVAPQWTRAQTLALAREVSTAVVSGALFAEMYGDRPARWDEALAGAERWRIVVNVLTRMRYCAADGTIDLKYKGAPGSQPPTLMPWFAVPGRRTANESIVFGHWSTLGRVHWPDYRVHGLDSGCVWGGRLTALELSSGAVSSVPCEGYAEPDES
jgi:bis(5'-nucleosyl)-tetraphosphatase (symmetrical)